MQKEWWQHFPEDPGGVVTKAADPTLPYKAPAAEADLTGKNLSNQRAPVQMQGDVLSNEAKRLEIEEKRKKAATGGDASESERTAAFLTTRLVGAADRIKSALSVDPTAAKPNILNNKILSAVDKDLANSNQTPQRQAIEAAQLELLDSALTLGTGAAYNREQLEGYRQSYFPQLGDSEYTIQSKQQALRTVIQAARLKAGSQAGAIDSALGALGLEDSTDKITATPQQYWDPSQDPADVEISKQSFERVRDPALAGVSARINTMLKSGAAPNDYVQYLKSVGIPPQEVMPSIFRALQWQREHPGYKGNYNATDVENSLVQTNPVRAAIGQVADTPYGAGTVGAANAMTAGYLDELAPGNTNLNNLGKQILAQNHPVANAIGSGLGGAALGLGAGEGAAALGLPSALRSAPLLDTTYGAAFGSGENNDNRGMGALMGAGAGLGGGLLARGAIQGAGSLVSPTGGRLAPLYAEGVQPTVGQRMGAAENPLVRAGNRIEQAFGSVPGFGGIQRGARNAAVTQMQTGAFNQALREIDTQLPKGITSGTHAHAFMQHAFDKAYDNARAGMRFAPDGEFATDFGQIINDVGILGADSRSAFAKMAEKIGVRLKARGGALNGDDYKLLLSEVDRKARAIRRNPQGDGELADALESLSAALDNGARRVSDPRAVQMLDKADRGYAKSVVIEDAARRRGGDAGEFSGTQLDAAVQNISGGRRSRSYLAGKANMQDYATAAKALGDTLNDSGSAERIMTAGGVVGAVKLGGPTTMIPWAGNTLANAPGIRKGVSALMAPRGGPKTKEVADWIRRRDRIASLFGVPLAIEAATGP